MHRIIQPGGLLWFTAHGESLTNRLSAAEKAAFSAREPVRALSRGRGHEPLLDVLA